MQLSDKSGIQCDRCGSIHCKMFVYYSFDFRKEEVYNNTIPRIVFSSKPIHSMDICEKCFNNICDLVKKHYKTAKIGLICDLTGQKMVGTFTYYHVNIIKADVLIPDMMNCTKCGSSMKAGEKCKCGNLQFKSNPSMRTDNRHIELCISQIAYNELTKR